MAETFSRKIFDSFIIDNNVVGFFEKPISLKSGRESSWYINWRTVSEDAFLLDQLSDFLLGFIYSLVADGKIPDPDTVYGVPEGASKLGILTQYKLAKKSPFFGKGSHVISMGRGKTKEHGDPKDRSFLGIPKGKTIVVEDVTTTGGSLLSALSALIEMDVNVICAIGLTDRMERCLNGLSVSEAIRQFGEEQKMRIEYYSLTNAGSFILEAIKKLNPSISILERLKEEFDKHSLASINF